MKAVCRERVNADGAAPDWSLESDTMIDLGHMYGDSGEAGNSSLAHYVIQRLPADYMINGRDLRWLDACDQFLQEPATNESVTAATWAAFNANPKGHIDPFELLIDANICDTKCEPVLPHER